MAYFTAATTRGSLMSDHDDTHAPASLDGEKTRLHINRVLIIEDTPDLAKIIELSLGQINVMTTVETSGARGLDACYELRPDLVLLDIGLPDMTGWRVLDAIKAMREKQTRPLVVIITAYGDPANRLMGKLQGVEGYLIKPFSSQEVQGLVKDLLHLE
jgi:DNA-binding response OmpR family regulator